MSYSILLKVSSEISIAYSASVPTDILACILSAIEMYSFTRIFRKKENWSLNDRKNMKTMEKIDTSDFMIIR